MEQERATTRPTVAPVSRNAAANSCSHPGSSTSRVQTPTGPAVRPSVGDSSLVAVPIDLATQGHHLAHDPKSEEGFGGESYDHSSDDDWEKLPDLLPSSEEDESKAGRGAYPPLSSDSDSSSDEYVHPVFRNMAKKRDLGGEVSSPGFPSPPALFGRSRKFTNCFPEHFSQEHVAELERRYRAIPEECLLQILL